MSTKAGVALAAVYLASTLTAWRLFPTFYCPFENWISDLGNSEYNPDGAAVFNTGCIIAGILAFAFTHGLKEWRTGARKGDLMLAVARGVGILSSAFLLMIGILSEDYPPYHGIVSVGFFASFGVFVLLFVASVFNHPKFVKPFGAFGFGVISVDLALGLVYLRPILEWITVATFLAFAVLVSLNMIRVADERPSPLDEGA